MHRYEEAIDSLRAALRLRADMTPTLTELAKQLGFLGRFDEAKDALHQVIRANRAISQPVSNWRK